MVTKEDAEQNPVGKAREGPSPLDEPKFVLFPLNQNVQLCLLVVRKRLFFGLHLHGKHFDLLSGEILNGQLFLLSLSSSSWSFFS